MNKLELKHIVGYLPYELKAIFSKRVYNVYGVDNDCIKIKNTWIKGNTTNSHDYTLSLKHIKLILRPISSMTNEEAYQLGVLIANKNEMEDKTVGIGKITVGEWEVPIINYADIDGEEYSFMVMFFNHGISATNGNNITFEAYEWLYENHFDIYGLIKQGIAIDINTL